MMQITKVAPFDASYEYQLTLVLEIETGDLYMRKSEWPDSQEPFPHVKYENGVASSGLLRHKNLVRSEEGFYQVLEDLGRRHDTCTTNTHLYDLGTLEHVFWRYREAKSMRPPKAFIWHLIEEVTDALIYMHKGHENADAVASPDAKPKRNWRPVAHRDVTLSNMLLDEAAPGKYPTIRLCDFDNAEGAQRTWES
jgi:serine/threonine protein kinase